jgi:peptidoglycan/xylan/chitin deacetylase (PgdA/CDA1 family)
LADSPSIRVVVRACAVLALAGALLCAFSSAARAQTVVSLTFDDGAISQYVNARPTLAAHGFHATFFVSSGFVNPRPDGSTNSYYMSWAQLSQLAAEGHEIGGKTLENKSLTTEVTDAAGRRHAVCDDRQNLIAHGFAPVSFTYPHGNFDATVERVVFNCGYASARLVGGLYDGGCFRCPVAESIPPRDQYAIASNSDVTGQLTAAALEGYVNRAAAAGGGWVPLNIRDVCYSMDCPPKSLNGSISPSELNAFLDWLNAGAPPGTVVKTVQEAAPARPASLTPHSVRPLNAPAKDNVVAFASIRVRKRQDIDKIRVSAAMLEPGSLSARGSVVVGHSSRSYKIKRATKSARPGKRVTLRLKLRGKDLRAAKRAIHGHRRVRARVTIIATDKPGNRALAKRTIVLFD